MAKKIRTGPHWMTGITMTPYHFPEDNVVHGLLELHTEEGTITIEIAEEDALGLIKAMEQFCEASARVLKPAA